MGDDVVDLDAGSVSLSAGVVQPYAAVWAVVYAIALGLPDDLGSQSLPLGGSCS